MPTNFIFILADDLGHADLGCYGGRAPVSPHLDRMAADGLRFTQGYANSPVCSPTRFALITGRYQYRLRGAAEEPLTGRYRGDKVVGLPPEHPTLPSLLRGAGYRTALIGKWHLGYAPHFGPLLSGYDEHFGPMSGGVDYFTHTDLTGKPDLWRNGEPVTAHGYLTDLLSDAASRFVRRCGEDRQPFLLSLHYTAPHWPWETRDDEHLAGSLVGRIAHLQGGDIATYQRMIHHMDEGIGGVLAALADSGQADNTLVVFTSDNGGERFSDNWPLVGGKMDLTEGGIRVPTIARWPAGIRPGVTHQHCMTMDWAATMLDIAGVAPHPDFPLDGLSLRPVFATPSQVIERHLFWRMKHRQQKAYRHGDWKWLQVDENDYLFNVARDARERANQKAVEPARHAAMADAFARWEAEMPPIPDAARAHLIYTDADMPQR
ncbi:sulfatase [Reyranella sp. CPCC 100927]|uniref:sulfatase family protein n=1 Tax=Reyranella sp. CPCC 100927 TaxID=2599616 RepID=UPI0015B3AAF4|nr:sulfatase-like hydrolase/transferase [Reyranella sp. CPCC 100927]